MVKRLHLLIVIFTLVATLTTMAGVASAQRVYTFDFEYAKIWINPDGTIDLFYNVSLTVESGEPINWVQIGQPNADYEIGESIDQYGRQLQTSRDDGDGESRVRVSLFEPLTAGNTIQFSLLTNVGNMIFNDTENEGNLGMQFAPAWRRDVPINGIRIAIVLPENVVEDDVKTPPNAFWNSTSIEPDGRLAVYWEKTVLQANEKYLVGVSFPASALPNYRPPTRGGFLENYGPILIISVVAIIVVVGIVILASRKKAYLAPKVSMETLGIKRGLTAVEASYLLDLKPTQTVTEILYSLLQKRAIWTESANPSLKLRTMPEFKNKKGTEENPLRYYEIDFLDAMKSDGSLDEEKLAQTVMYLCDTVEEKLRGYNRNETVDYYRKIVTQAWTQVEQAGTVELASKAYDEQLLWLLLDPNNRSRTETAFRNRVFEPNPLWFWYWYGYTHYNPHPSYKPNIEAPARSAKPPAIPGAEFANNIATAMEKTSSNIVVNIEKFANAIIPAQTAKASHEPAHQKADCVCACHACACACACVSCACACAGGGVG